MTPSRERCVELCRSLAGLGMGTDPARYLDLVAGAGEVGQLRQDMGRMSGCALVARGIWRQLGIRHPILERSYRQGRAVADLVDIALAAEALHLVPAWARLLPRPGDVIVARRGNDEHVWTVLRVRAQDWPGAGDLLAEGLDGGQRDERGRQTIQIVEHEIAGLPPRDEKGRPVTWLIDFDAVWRRFGRIAA